MMKQGSSEWAGSKIVDGKCFLFNDTSSNWDNALTACTNMDGTLATITSKTQLNKVISELSLDSNHFWIGGNDKVTEGTLVWAETNKPATELTGDLMGNRGVNYVSSDCAMVLAGTGMVFIRDCDETVGYLCMEPNSTTTNCPLPSTTTTTTTTTQPPTTQPPTTLATSPATTTPITAVTQMFECYPVTTDGSALTSMPNILLLTLTSLLTSRVLIVLM